MNSITEKETSGIINGHEWVDLGLPSGTLWATCNIGASKPSDFGDYFAWGETTAKNSYSPETYKWADASLQDKWAIGSSLDAKKIYGISLKGITKYCNKSYCGSNGFVDDLTLLESKDDVAAINWGADWRMPTRAECVELNEKCVWKRDGNGYRATGPNGNSIFMPAAGYMYGNNLLNAGSYGDYWSSSLSTYSPNGAYSFCFGSDKDLLLRHIGKSVRAVCGKALSEKKDIVKKDALAMGNLNGHDWIDLGLPSGTKWATCNMGADTPNDFGNYYAWGEIATKKIYNWDTYKHSKGEEQLIKYCKNCWWEDNGFVDNITKLQPSDDVAIVNWGEGWRVPKRSEFIELMGACTWKLVGDGYNVIGPNGNSIFLPIAGYRDDVKISDSIDAERKQEATNYGIYWASSLSLRYSYNAWCLLIHSTFCDVRNSLRFEGCSIRPVCSE